MITVTTLDEFYALKEVLKANAQEEELSLEINFALVADIDTHIDALSDALKTAHVKSISLSACQFSDDLAVHMITALRDNPLVEQILTQNDQLGPKGTQALRSLLENNHKIKHLVQIPIPSSQAPLIAVSTLDSAFATHQSTEDEQNKATPNRLTRVMSSNKLIDGLSPHVHALDVGVSTPPPTRKNRLSLAPTTPLNTPLSNQMWTEKGNLAMQRKRRMGTKPMATPSKSLRHPPAATENSAATFETVSTPVAEPVKKLMPIFGGPQMMGGFAAQAAALAAKRKERAVGSTAAQTPVAVKDAIPAQTVQEKAVVPALPPRPKANTITQATRPATVPTETVEVPTKIARPATVPTETVEVPTKIARPATVPTETVEVPTKIARPATVPTETGASAKVARSVKVPTGTARPAAALPTEATRPAAALPTEATRPAAELPTEATRPAAALPTETARPPAALPTETARPPAALPTETARPPAALPTETARPAATLPTETARPAATLPTETARPPAALPTETARPAAALPTEAAASSTKVTVSTDVAMPAETANMPLNTITAPTKKTPKKAVRKPKAPAIVPTTAPSVTDEPKLVTVVTGATKVAKSKPAVSKKEKKVPKVAAPSLAVSTPARFYVVSDKISADDINSVEAANEIYTQSTQFMAYEDLQEARDYRLTKKVNGYFGRVCLPVIYTIEGKPDRIIANRAAIGQAAFETVIFTSTPLGCSQNTLLSSITAEQTLRDLIEVALKQYEKTMPSLSEPISPEPPILTGVCSTLGLENALSNEKNHSPAGVTRAQEFHDRLGQLNYQGMKTEITNYVDGMFSGFTGNYERDKSFKAILYTTLLKVYGEDDAKMMDAKDKPEITKQKLLDILEVAYQQISDIVLKPPGAKPSAIVNKSI